MKEKTNEIIPIFFASDKNYLPYLAIAIKSIAKNIKSKNQYKIYVLTDDIDEENFKKLQLFEKKNLTIEKVDVNNKIESIKKKVPLRDYYSVSIYFRLFIPSLFPQYEKGIYLDSDIIANCDIKELFDTKLDDNFLGVVLDEVIWSSKEFTYYSRNALDVTEKEYFNSGVLVMNLKQFREQNIEEDFYHYIKTYDFGTVAPDQDYLNVTCKGKTVILDGSFNKMPMGKKLPDEKLKIIHFNMFMKPWKYSDTLYGEYFWKYAKGTEFYKFLKEKQNTYTDEFKINDKYAYDNLVKMALDIANSNNTYKKIVLKKFDEDKTKGLKLVEDFKSPDRIEVLKKIKQNELNGQFDADVENDPPAKELFPAQIDYLQKRFSTKIKTKYANHMGEKFLKTVLKNNQLIIKKIEGLENFENLKSGAIITCNHFNPLDTFAIQYAYKKAKQKKRKLFRVIKEGNYTSMTGFYGLIMKYCNTLPLSRNHKTMANFISSINSILKSGNFVLVYPEQAMWWNYKKPRPLKDGAFKFAVKNNVPVLPLFITMEDSENVGQDGFKIQEYTIHISKPIYPQKDKTMLENIKLLMEENYDIWKNIYETTYNIPLTYETKLKKEAE